MLQVVSASKMKVGRKSDGKHWTKAEVEARRAAAETMKRKTPVKLKPPAWLKEDLAAYRIWSAILRDARDLELLDNLDASALATYCKLESEKEAAVKAGDTRLFDRLAKTSLAYARSLGLTPDARARLAKKKADATNDPNAELFD